MFEHSRLGENGCNDPLMGRLGDTRIDSTVVVQFHDSLW